MLLGQALAQVKLYAVGGGVHAFRDPARTPDEDRIAAGAFGDGDGRDRADDRGEVADCILQGAGLGESQIAGCSVGVKTATPPGTVT